MKVVKPDTHIGVYRAWAEHAADISYLSGRKGNAFVTEFINQEVLLNLLPSEDDVIVDLGCGDGMLLRLAAQHYRTKKAIGVLPSSEEVNRLNSFILESGLDQNISIINGVAERIPLPDNFANITIANGVLLLLQDEASVEAAIQEMFRITKCGGTIFVGEMPCLDERKVTETGLAPAPAPAMNRSVISRIQTYYRELGLLGLIERIKQAAMRRISNNVIVVGLPPTVWMEPDSFIEMIKRNNLSLKRFWRHKKIDAAGTVSEHYSRYNYLAIKNNAPLK